MGLKSFNTETTNNNVKGGKVSRYTDKELLDALAEFKEEHGEFTAEDYQRIATNPSYSTIQRRFGTFNNARIKAGIGVNKSGGKQIAIGDDMKKASREKAFLVGCLLCDGWVCCSDPHYNVGFQVKDKEFAERFGIELSKWSGLRWDGWNSNQTEMEANGPIKVEETENDNWRIKKGSKHMTKYLQKFESSSATEILEHFSEYKKELLSAIWDCEGSISGSQIRFANSNAKLNKMFMLLLDSLTLMTYDTVPQWATDKEKYKKCGDFTMSTVIANTDVRNITFPSKFNSEFANLVDSNVDRKAQKLERWD